MKLAQGWTDRVRVIAGAALLACCGLVVAATLDAVATDDVSDAVALALNAAALATLTVSIAASLLVALSAKASAMRAVVGAMALLVVALAGLFVRHAYPDVSIELAYLIAPAEAGESATQIVLGPRGDDVRLSGDIKAGAGALLETILAAHPAVRRIALTSDGGLADEGQALADVISAHRLTTYVPDYCVSACTLAFVGGRERIAMDGARLGFHAPYAEGLLGQAFAGDAKQQRAAYLAAGLSTDFVDEALKVAPDDLWIPGQARLLAAHVVTSFVDRYRFPDSILDGAADRPGARDAVLRNFSILKSIDAVSPRTVDRIADWYLSSYRRGTSEGEATDRLERIVGATTLLVLVRADDATLLDLARFLDAAMEVDPRPRDCAAIGERVDLVRAAAVVEDSDKEADAHAASLVARALAAGRNAPPPNAVTPAALGAVDRSCTSWRELYAGALEHHDVTMLRRRLVEERPDAARILAGLAASKT